MILDKIFYKYYYKIKLLNTFQKIVALNYKKLSRNYFSPKNIIINSILSNKSNNYVVEPIFNKTYDDLNYIFKKLEYYKSDRQEFIKLYNKNTIDNYKKLLKQNRGSLKYFIYDKYKSNFKNINGLNDAFLKLYEVLANINIININIINNNNFYSFHFAEAPGGFIIATNVFLKSLKPDINHIWYANSYNPYSNNNLSNNSNDLYKSGFGDNYGLIKRHTELWLFGKDGTGDITIRSNILNIKNKLKDIKLDLITGDGGLGLNASLIDLQKLDYAQMVLISMVGTIGSNCCIKIFLNYMNGKNNENIMKSSFGLYLSIIKMYHNMYKKIYLIKPSMSADDSGEYYIIGATKENQNKLLDILDNFKTDITFLELDDDFIEQILNFYNKIIDLNINNVIEQNILTQCNDKHVYSVLKKYLDKTKCKIYFDKKKYENKVIEFNQNWIDDNNFNMKDIVIDL